MLLLVYLVHKVHFWPRSIAAPILFSTENTRPEQILYYIYIMMHIIRISPVGAPDAFFYFPC